MNKLKKTVCTMLAAVSIMSGSSGIVPMAAGETSRPLSQLSHQGSGGYVYSAKKDGTAPLSTLNYFGEEGAPTREEAAVTAFEYLVSEGWELSGDAGNLSMFEDGKSVSPEAAKAVAELVRLGILKTDGVRLYPRERITQDEARKLAEDVIALREGGADPLAALGLDVIAEEALAERVRCVLCALVMQGKDRLEGVPDAGLASLAVYLAYTTGAIPEAVCQFGGRDAVIITQTGYSEGYYSLFAEGEPSSLNPAATGENIEVLGDYIVFYPGYGDGITLSCGTLMDNGGERFTLWCTLKRDGKYLCTASVGLEFRDGTLPVVSTAELAWG